MASPGPIVKSYSGGGGGGKLQPTELVLFDVLSETLEFEVFVVSDCDDSLQLELSSSSSSSSATAMMLGAMRRSRSSTSRAGTHRPRSFRSSGAAVRSTADQGLASSGRPPPLFAAQARRGGMQSDSVRSN